MSISSSNKIIIVGDIHSDFIKFFEPLKQANIIRDYNIYPDSINYSFVDCDSSDTSENEKPTAEVIYVGDFIHRGGANQIFILDALIDICNKYPDNVKFVLGNHDIAECDYYLEHSNADLFQFSTMVDHNICKQCPQYATTMGKFIDFLKTKKNLLKIEYPEFIISHTIHSKLIPSSLELCIENSMKFCKTASMVRPKTPRYKLPPYFTNKPEYLAIINKFKKPTLKNYDEYFKAIKDYITSEYPNYIRHIEEANIYTNELFDEFIHHELDIAYYYEIFKYDLFGSRSEAGLTSSIGINYPKLQIVGHDRREHIEYSKGNNIIWCDCLSESWLVYVKNSELNLNLNEKYKKIEGLDGFYIYTL